MFCYVLLYNFLLDLYIFCWFNKIFSSNMYKFILDHLHDQVMQSRDECHRKHAWSQFPYYFHTMKYYLLYSSTNYNYCFGNKSTGYFKVQTRSITYLQYIMMTWKIKHEIFSNILLFQTENIICLWLKRFMF